MRRRLGLAALLTPPMLWLVVAYLGALVAIFATAFWTTDPFTNLVVRTFTLDNFRELRTPTYLGIIGRTILIAALVTVLCVVVAVPFAFFMARVAPARSRSLLLALVLVPLWASYLVKAYAWRAMLQPSGVLESVFGTTPGYGFAAVVITLSYLWLPYMILPVYAAFERLPESHLEASADLGGRPWTTFRRVVVPALWPAIAAGSVFTFSLSLGDYIAVSIVGGKLQVLGTAVLQNITLDLPFAAALGTSSVVVMVLYLLAVRRAGALENL
ncbi:spermidine/putrescine ABC transporter permease [Intrasporangium oryzae NRRL B-24470]|uniref:Spermidine/putrescine ABC transporter permease n=1 Tax=Intrasporangium oryzae NRRL B-24470 TaxID=1386089 RepID=W9G4M1_9MICO|nr:ABC transporter permease [Intrasporangium oryzae]EWT01066.1 spermidine/putrescine ABC transporter permease [Intrasporangium oryzae NRRL B-24470]